jgi:hypothetical protein
MSNSLGPHQVSIRPCICLQYDICLYSTHTHTHTHTHTRARASACYGAHARVPKRLERSFPLQTGLRYCTLHVTRIYDPKHIPGNSCSVNCNVTEHSGYIFISFSYVPADFFFSPIFVTFSLLQLHFHVKQALRLLELNLLCIFWPRYLIHRR